MEALFVEFVGTFVFISVIFRFASEAWGAFAIGAALVGAILFGGYASGGHFNPAVSMAMYVANNLSLTKLCGYIVVQLLAAYCAWMLNAKQLLPSLA